MPWNQYAKEKKPIPIRFRRIQLIDKEITNYEQKSI